MRFSTRGLDDTFTYPCTKSDVREAFENDLLSWVRFDGDHFWSRRETPGDIKGLVLMTLGVSNHPFLLDEQGCPRASLHVYRMRKEKWSELLHWQLRETMRTTLRPWTEAMLTRPETAWLGYERMFVELCQTGLRTHVRRGLN